MTVPVPEFDAGFRVAVDGDEYTVYVPGLGISATDPDYDKAATGLVRQLRKYAHWWTHSDNPRSESPERSAALAAQVEAFTDAEILEWIDREPNPDRTYLPRSAPIEYAFAGFDVQVEDDGTPILRSRDLYLVSAESTLTETVSEMTCALLGYADEWTARSELRNTRSHNANAAVVSAVRSMTWPQIYDFVLTEIRDEAAIAGISAAPGLEAERLWGCPARHKVND